jgi:hypothetical protein
MLAVPADDELLPALELPAAVTALPAAPVVPALEVLVPAVFSAAPRGPSWPPLQPKPSPKTNPRPRTKLVAVDFMRIHQW